LQKVAALAISIRLQLQTALVVPVMVDPVVVQVFPIPLREI
jgi:hypothetical protein